MAHWVCDAGDVSGRVVAIKCVCFGRSPAVGEAIITIIFIDEDHVRGGIGLVRRPAKNIILPTRDNLISQHQNSLLKSQQTRDL
jgi:hypothetical protein